MIGRERSACLCLCALLLAGLSLLGGCRSHTADETAESTDRSTLLSVSLTDRTAQTTEGGDPPEVPTAQAWQWDPHCFDLLADTYQTSAEKLADAILAYEDSVTLASGEAQIVCDNFAFEFPPAALVDLAVEGDEVEITYLYDRATHDGKIAAFESAVENALNSTLEEGDSESVRALLLYGYVVSNVRYFSVDYTEKQTTAFSALTDGVTICYGFADAFGYLLRQTGMEAHMVRGARSDGAEHGWTYAKVDGKWYHFDPTWETSNQKTSGVSGLYYFGMNDTRRFSSLVRQCVYGFGELESAGAADSVPEWLIPTDSYPYLEWKYDRESGELRSMSGVEIWGR